MQIKCWNSTMKKIVFQKKLCSLNQYCFLLSKANKNINRKNAYYKLTMESTHTHTLYQLYANANILSHS